LLICLDNLKKIREKERPAKKKGRAKRRYRNQKSKNVFIETKGLKGKDNIKTNETIIDIEESNVERAIKKSALSFILVEK